MAEAPQSLESDALKAMKKFMLLSQDTASEASEDLSVAQLLVSEASGKRKKGRIT